MKFTVEVELDWLYDESSIDKAVQEKLITEISKKINNKVKQKVLSEAISRIENQLGELLNEFLEEILNQNITVTDEWGNTTKIQLIKEP